MTSTRPEPVSTEYEGRQLWLVKIPASLREEWIENTDSEKSLGSLIMHEPVQGSAKRRCTVRLSDSGAQGSLPKEYKLEFTPAPPRMRIFSEDEEGHLSMEGQVKESATMMPHRSEEYRKLCRNRLIQSLSRGRTVQQLESAPKFTKSATQVHLSIDSYGDEPGKADKRDDRSSRVKLDKESLKTMIFHHFENREFWPFKELNGLLRQPESHVKDVLKEICIYHRKGANKNCYELKSQYKQNLENI